jgi:hypothetical protein
MSQRRLGIATISVIAGFFIAIAGTALVRWSFQDEQPAPPPQ